MRYYDVILNIILYYIVSYHIILYYIVLLSIWILTQGIMQHSKRVSTKQVKLFMHGQTQERSC